MPNPFKSWSSAMLLIATLTLFEGAHEIAGTGGLLVAIGVAFLAVTLMHRIDEIICERLPRFTVTPSQTRQPSQPNTGTGTHNLE